jgi:hypothetical protein
MLRSLTPALADAILRSLVFDGPAVDGVSLRQTMTIDRLDMLTHGRMREAVCEVALDRR